jgi:xyloglucan-specific exo-beta-1,4-glucanase
MKTSIIYCLFLFFSMPILYAQQGIPECDIPFSTLKEQKDAYFEILRQQIGDEAMNEEGSKYTQYQKWLRYWEPRIAPNGTTREYNNSLAVSSKKGTPTSKSLGNMDSWTELGPYNKPNSGLNTIGSGDLGVGVIQAMVIHKSNSNKLLCWSSGSGLFYSSNKAQNWSNAGSDQWPRSGCKWAEFAPDNETTWYACSAPGGSLYDAYNAIGKNCGLYRTLDAGATWHIIADYVDLDPATPANGEPAVLQKILIDPNAPNVGYLATSIGLYVSTNINSVSMVTWSKVLNGSICDMEFRTNGGSHLYVSYKNGPTWNIAYTTNLGSSWTSVPNQPAYTSVYHVSLAVSENAPNNLYVVQRNSLASLYQYDLNTFGVPTLLSSFADHVGAGYGFAVSNFNANIMYASIGIRFHKSINGGITWTVVSASSPTRYHDDVEYFVTPSASCGTCSNEFYVATHGGVNYSPDQVATLSSRSNGLGVARITGSSNAALNPEKIIMGLDHDGSVLSSGVYSASWIPSWETVQDGDGMKALFDYSNSNYAWTTSQFTQPFLSSTGGVAFSYSPTGFPPKNDFGATYAQNRIFPNILYCKAATDVSGLFYEDLYRSDNRGDAASLIEQVSDFKTFPSPVITPQYYIFGILPAPSDPNYCYVALGNNVTWDGKLYRSTNMLDPSASNVKNSWKALDDNNNSSLQVVDHTNPNIVILARGGIWPPLELTRADYTNPATPVFNNIAGVAGSGGLPNIRVLQVVLEKGSNGGIYVATDAGIYYADKSTLSLTNPANCYWIKLGVNLPNIPVTGMEINYQVNKLRVSTSGRGIWEHDLFCPSNMAFEFTAAQNTNAFYEVINQIISTSKVGPTSKITYRAGTYIDLKPGFTSTTNSSNYFEAFIHPCSYPGNSPGLKMQNGKQGESVEYGEPWGLENASEITVYPNPNNGKFKVSINVDEEYTIDVYSLMGQKVLSLPKAKIREKEIDLTGYQKGIYLIELKSDKDFKSVKVVYE